MKLFGGTALPSDLATVFTSTFALTQAATAGLQETCSRMSDRARSWYKKSELVDRVHLFGGGGFITILGPAICADMVLRPTKYSDVPHVEAMKLLLKASLTIGPKSMAISAGESTKIAAGGMLSYISSRNVWLDHFINNPLAVFKIWNMLAVSALEEATRMLNDYASLKILEYEAIHRTEGA